MKRDKENIWVLVVDVACSIPKVHVMVKDQNPFKPIFFTQKLHKHSDVIEEAEASAIVSAGMMIATA